MSGPDGTGEESYDYLVNATYAGRNLVAQWFGFPTEPLRFDLYELLLLRLPIPQICATVLDGPFTSLIGTGQEDLFLLSHIHDSVSRSVIGDEMHALARDIWRRGFKEFVREATRLNERDRGRTDADRRVRFGMYCYRGRVRRR